MQRPHSHLGPISDPLLAPALQHSTPGLQFLHTYMEAFPMQPCAIHATCLCNPTIMHQRPCHHHSHLHTRCTQCILAWHSGPQQQRCMLGQPHLKSCCHHCLYTQRQASTPCSQSFFANTNTLALAYIHTLDTPLPLPVDQNQTQDWLHAQVTIPATMVPADHRLHTQLTIHVTTATQHHQLHAKLATTQVTNHSAAHHKAQH